MLSNIREVFTMLKPIENVVEMFELLEKQYMNFEVRNFFLHTKQLNSNYPMIELLFYDKTTYVDLVITKHSLTHSVTKLSNITQITLKFNDVTQDYYESEPENCIEMSVGLKSYDAGYVYKTAKDYLNKLVNIQNDLITLIP